MEFKNHYRGKLGFFLVILLLSGCQSPKVSEVSSSEPTPTISESRLSLYNAILEQANSEGGTLWKIKSVETVYSPDRQTAYLQQVTGNFWQDNELAVYLTAIEGEVLEDGEVIILRNNVVAKDLRNGTVIKADQLTWYPREDLLIVEGNLAGQNPNLNVTAKKAKYHTDTQQLELIGDVLANNLENSIQFKSPELRWNLGNQTLLVNSPLEIVRYNQEQVITERVIAEELEVDLIEHQAHFKKNVEFVSWEPIVQIASNSIIWNYQDNTLMADQPVQLIHQEEELTLTGNQGFVDLVAEVARLEGGVQGETTRNQAKLYASQLIWSIDSQEVEAQENVIYEQMEPYIYLTGDRAVGTLQDNNVVVTGDRSEQVITEIKPAF